MVGKSKPPSENEYFALACFQGKCCSKPHTAAYYVTATTPEEANEKVRKLLWDMGEDDISEVLVYDSVEDIESLEEAQKLVDDKTTRQ